LRELNSKRREKRDPVPTDSYIFHYDHIIVFDVHAGKRNYCARLQRHPCKMAAAPFTTDEKVQILEHCLLSVFLDHAAFLNSCPALLRRRIQVNIETREVETLDDHGYARTGNRWAPLSPAILLNVLLRDEEWRYYETEPPDSEVTLGSTTTSAAKFESILQWLNTALQNAAKAPPKGILNTEFRFPSNSQNSHQSPHPAGLSMSASLTAADVEQDTMASDGAHGSARPASVRVSQQEEIHPPSQFERVEHLNEKLDPMSASIDFANKHKHGSIPSREIHKEERGSALRLSVESFGADSPQGSVLSMRSSRDPTETSNYSSGCSTRASSGIPSSRRRSHDPVTLRALESAPEAKSASEVRPCFVIQGGASEKSRKAVVIGQGDHLGFFPYRTGLTRKTDREDELVEDSANLRRKSHDPDTLHRLEGGSSIRSHEAFEVASHSRPNSSNDEGLPRIHTQKTGSQANSVKDHNYSNYNNLIDWYKVERPESYPPFSDDWTEVSQPRTISASPRSRVTSL
jgi:hypothetical protein